MVFSEHSLATDTVFSEVELVSCRNVLIYFERALQSRAYALFHDALAPRGFLGIGSKESLRFSKVNAKFEEFAQAERIYRKR
jgi:chemotaxis protein methyltransferase CheR